MSNPLVRRTRAATPVWWLVRTKRYGEERARLHLERCGYPTYLPKTHRWPRPVVGGSVVPLFPGYLFVRAVAPQNQRRVMRTPGVTDFVRAGGGEPATVPAAVIEFLKGREGRDGLIDCRALSKLGGHQRLMADDLGAEFFEVSGRTAPGAERSASILDLLGSTNESDARPPRLRRSG